MADNYLQFSEEYSLSVAQEKWVLIRLEAMDELTDGEEPGEKHFVLLGEELAVSMAEEGCFEWTLKEQKLWVSSDVGGNISAVATLLHLMAARFKLQRKYTLTWSESCSKPRLGQFGGGAFVASAEGIKYMNSWQWAEENS